MNAGNTDPGTNIWLLKSMKALVWLEIPVVLGSSHPSMIKYAVNLQPVWNEVGHPPGRQQLSLVHAIIVVFYGLEANKSVEEVSIPRERYDVLLLLSKVYAK